jgi:Concanavalin A-like lectin/glucanases superfamily
MDSVTQRLMASAGGPVDPNFRNVTLLLHGDGTNGAQNNTFVDSSTNNFTITRNGNTTQGSLSPYGNLWSNFFDGTGDWLTAPSSAAFDFGTGDFTIEFFANMSLPSTGYVFLFSADYATTSQGLDIRFGDNGFGYKLQVGVDVYSLSTVWSCSLTQAQASNAWLHIAFTRSSGVCRLFVNGVVQNINNGANPSTYPFTSFTDSANLSSSTGVKIGDGVLGYMSNLRIIKGTALYTSNFTPSTTPLTAVSGTSLLTCQSNRFIDNSSNNFTITRNGDVSVQPFSPFAPSAEYSTSVNGGSGYFDGTGDYLSIPSTSSLTLSGDYTIEAWLYVFNEVASFRRIFQNAPGTTPTGYYYVYTNGNQIRMYTSDFTTLAINLGTFVTLSWFHLAITRSGSTTRVFINGTQTYSYTSTFSFTNNGWFIGGGPTWEFNNFMIAGHRVVVGTALYTSNFTPPSSPPTAVTNTALLCNFTNAGIFDSAADNVLETVGNAQISTSVTKFGTGSLAFDGTGDWLACPDNVGFAFGTGDFTIEAWVWLDSTVNPGRPDGLKTVTVLSTGSSGSNDCSFAIYGNTSTAGVGLELYQASPTITASVAATVSTNTWVHIAFVRTGTTIYGFVNGTRYTLTTTSSSIASSTAPKIGAGNTPSYTNQFKGYIDDLRITKGVARYTSNFTPPTGPFPNL